MAEILWVFWHDQEFGRSNVKLQNYEKSLKSGEGKESNVKTVKEIDYWGDIRKFRDALLKSDIGHQIAKIVWFGSTLKKKAQESSDVDLLIITGDGEMVQDRIADVLLDFQMTTRSPLEIVTSHIDELYPITDYFLKNVLTYGQEVYSMPEEDLKHSGGQGISNDK